jgi:predicted RND superfamily exporter protein
MLSFFTRLLSRRAGLVAFIGTALAFIGLFYTIQLFKNLRTDFEELLPTTARSVLDLKEVTHRLESIDNVGVLIFSKNPKASLRFVNDLARELQRQPKSLISSVEYKISEELLFFKQRQALYMDLADLKKIRTYVRDRIAYERDLYNPLNIFEERELVEPQLDFKAMRQKYETQTSSYSRFPGGYYATADGTKRVVLVYKPGGSGMDASLALKAAVEGTIQGLNPASYSPDMEIHYTGGVQDQIEEHGALIEDLELSTVIVALLVGIGMWLFYRNLRATAALLTSLFMGTFWTFGASFFAVGYLNANSAFMGSIVIGNGINFGIIYLARYLEVRRTGQDPEKALSTCLAHTATSTWTAALAAGLSYGSLILTDFRGFRQFGIIGLIGMVLCWISAFTLLPAYLSLLERWKPLVKPHSKPPRAILSGVLAWVVEKCAWPITVISIAATVVSIAMFSRYTPKILETDLSKLRNKHSLEEGSSYMSKYLDEIFQRYLSPMVVLPKTREDTLAIAEAVRAKKKADGPNSLFASVQTMDDFVPKDQLEKIAVIRNIRRELPPKLVRRISDADQSTITEFLTDAVLKPITMKDMPGLVVSKFTEKDGTVGKLVLVEPPLTHETWEGENLIRMTRELREAADSVRPGTAVAGTLAITSDMIESVGRDGPHATLIAFIAVMVLVVVLFRRADMISLVLGSLLLGVLWLAGLILGLNLKINFLNFIALPITFGIGVDYGVNVFHRYRHDKEAAEKNGLPGDRANILHVISTTGGAVGLCSYTTVIGYVSLLIASNQGFVSFGTLAVAGELTCVFAALVTIPAVLVLLDRRHRKTATPGA